MGFGRWPPPALNVTGPEAGRPFPPDALAVAGRLARNWPPVRIQLRVAGGPARDPCEIALKRSSSVASSNSGMCAPGSKTGASPTGMGGPIHGGCALHRRGERDS